MSKFLKHILEPLRRLDVRLAIAFLVVVVALVAQAMQPDAIDVARAEAARIAADEGRAYRAWESIWATAGETWDEQDVSRIEKEVLPPWREARRRLIAVRSGSMERFFPGEMEDFFRLREEAWESLVTSVRTNDPEAFARYEQLFRQAEAAGTEVVEIRKREAAALAGAE